MMVERVGKYLRITLIAAFLAWLLVGMIALLIKGAENGRPLARLVLFYGAFFGIWGFFFLIRALIQGLFEVLSDWWLTLRANRARARWR